MSGVSTWWGRWVQKRRDCAEQRRRQLLTGSLLPLLNEEAELALALGRHTKRLWYPHLREQVEGVARASEGAVQKLREAVVAQGVTPAPPAPAADEEMTVVECLSQDIERLRAMALAHRDAADLAQKVPDERLVALLGTLRRTKVDQRQVLLQIVTRLDGYAR